MSLKIGFDRRIELAWLDALTARLTQGADPGAARGFLHDLLEPEHPALEARTKTVAVLMRIWVTVPPEYQHLRQDAFTQIAGVSGLQSLWFHWGMALLAFPLFRTTAATVGRLLTVQGDVSPAQVKRRLAETLGQRETLMRACRRILVSMSEWGTLSRTGVKGHLGRGPVVLAASDEVQLWLLEAALRASGAQEMAATQLLGSPELFPFQLTAGIGDIRRSSRFEVHRQGVDMDIVALRAEGNA